ncbi:hypothetical protein CYLTODRAFT_488356 [Cylindrobasidium torrendii FP15055 ss-10]|uniref:BTB domain-containing protein n=1 Tax=Cylindrobasidium torrendii FP15055 ss-10 TaxID=1314674 RepID=A0A0D7BHP2_9AGAR|nr:hypothetical protein CYLTODRAFT_488356 [Cylindrobasidium torrendii FP15055 ss-10]
MSTAVTIPDSGNPPDIALRSSDGLVIRTHKTVLMYASEFFNNLLADGRPEDTFENLPLCAMPENGIVLQAIVMLCAPVHVEAQDLLPALSNGSRLQDALDKYMMEQPSRRLTAFFRSYSRSLVETEPLRAFAVADAFNVDDVLLAAARNTLKTPISSWPPSPPELMIMSPMRYHKLVRYFQKCVAAASASLNNWDEIRYGHCTECGVSLTPEYGPSSDTSYTVRPSTPATTAGFHSKFQSSWIAEKAKGIVTYAPGIDISRPLNRILAEASTCRGSWENHQRRVDEIVAEVARRVDAAISGVSFYDA